MRACKTCWKDHKNYAVTCDHCGEGLLETDIINGHFKSGEEFRIIKDSTGHVRLIMESSERQHIKTKHKDNRRYIDVESFNYPS